MKFWMNKLIHSGITTYIPEIKNKAGLFKLFEELKGTLMD